MSSIRRQNGAVSKAREGKGSGLCARLLGSLRLLLSLGLLVMNLLIPKVAVGQDSAGEYELKAAMLFNLTRFVEWPTSAYANIHAPTVLCILGRDPFGDSLTSIASGQAGGGRPVEIRRIANIKEIRGCHMVYISSSERKNITLILRMLKGTSVLTVGEMAQFAARGGMIQFSLEEKQVRFEVNLEAAAEADLRISSRLLVLARVVKDPNKNPAREGSALRLPSIEAAVKQPSKDGCERGITATIIANESPNEAGGRR